MKTKRKNRINEGCDSPLQIKEEYSMKGIKMGKRKKTQIKINEKK